MNQVQRAPTAGAGTAPDRETWRRILRTLVLHGCRYHSHPEGVLSYGRRKLRAVLPRADRERQAALEALSTDSARRFAANVLEHGRQEGAR